MGGPKRVRGCTVARPIVYGNTARPLGTKQAVDPNHTHEWTVFVRGVNGEDISYVVRKVMFKLHDTYANSARISETGWGEFEVQIRIYWALEAVEKATTIYHHLKLHPYGLNLSDGAEQKPSDKVVSSIQYDEIVFHDPTEDMYDLLMRHPIAPLPQERTADNLFSKRTEQEELARLDEAIAKVEAMTQHYRAQIMILEKELNLTSHASTQ